MVQHMADTVRDTLERSVCMGHRMLQHAQSPLTMLKVIILATLVPDSEAPIAPSPFSL